MEVFFQNKKIAKFLCMISALELDQSKVPLLCSHFLHHPPLSSNAVGSLPSDAQISFFCRDGGKDCFNFSALPLSAMMRVYKYLLHLVNIGNHGGLTRTWSQCPPIAYITLHTMCCVPSPSIPTNPHVFEFRASIASTKWMKPSQCIDRI